MVCEREADAFICLFGHPKLQNLYNLFDLLKQSTINRFLSTCNSQGSIKMSILFFKL